MSDFDYYRIFYYVAESGSFSRAASLLDSSQPNITRCINNLEDSLRCRLFERSSRGVKLTDAGKKLYAHVKPAVRELEAGRAEILNETSITEGIVTIGVSENALQLVLARALSLYLKEHPAVHIHLCSLATNECMQAVSDGAVDFSLSSSPVQSEKGLHVQPLLRYFDCLIAGPAYAGIASHVHSLAELADEPFIMLEKGSATRQLYESFFQEHGCSLNPAVEVHTGNEVLQLAEHDIGLGFYPSGAIKKAISVGRICRFYIHEKLPERTICLIYDAGRILSPAAATMVRLLQKNISQRTAVQSES